MDEGEEVSVLTIMDLSAKVFNIFIDATKMLDLKVVISLKLATIYCSCQKLQVLVPLA